MDKYELIKQLVVTEGIVYYIRNTTRKSDEIDLTMAIDKQKNLLVWNDIGTDGWCIVNGHKFYEDIAKQLKIRS